jgi:hypothetical protein
VHAAGAGALPNHHHKRGDAINGPHVLVRRADLDYLNAQLNDPGAGSADVDYAASLVIEHAVDYAAPVDCANVDCVYGARHHGPCRFHANDDADRGT